jgi:hypothetical protein
MVSSCRIIALVVLVFFGNAALAHHNTGAYFDTEVEFVIDGVIDEVQWRNPHVYFTITGTSDSGKTSTWRIEAGPTGIMRRLDWNKNTLRSGDAVTVTANPSRREGVRSGYLVSASSPDKEYPVLRGKPVLAKLATNDVEVEEVATDISGVWITLFNGEYFGKIFGDDAVLPLSEKGQASMDSFDETRDAPALECIPAVAPAMMTTPDIKLITVTDHEIRIRAEFNNSERVIHMTPGATAEGPTLHGHSTGSWNEGVLTIRSDKFGPHRTGALFSVESSPKKTLVETFRLNEDGKSLTYSFVMEDPEMLTEPLTGEFQWAYRPDIEYESLECDLENSRQYLKD